MNTNTIKVSLAGLLLLAASSSYAIAESKDSVKDELCLLYGQVAQHTAKYRDMGMSESQLIKSSRTSKSEKFILLSEKIIGYVFTMELGQSDARKLVYLKCKSGAYD